MMKVVLALALGAATAFVGPVAGPTAATVVNGKAEMVELAETNPDFLGRTIGFWDPFNLIEEGDFWGLGNEGTIGYLRHAEIKHGRVAMAGFLGFCLQSLPVVAGGHMLESYGEGAGSPEGYVHYTKGGLPGYFPDIAGRAGFGQVGINLFDPFNWFDEGKDKE